jgi:hypothetical protein
MHGETNMVRFCVTAGVVAAVWVGALASASQQALPKTIKPNQVWKGSIADVNLKKGVPEVITSAREFEKLWKDWKIDGKVPEVDFTKELVAVGTTVGSTLQVSGALDDKGDLRIVSFGTADFGEGFRYVIVTLNRDGVKTVNGKKLP